MRRTLNSPKTGHASQPASHYGPHGHSAHGRPSIKLASRAFCARKPDVRSGGTTFQTLYGKEAP